MSCAVEGCDRAGSPVCPMHRKRQQRGADLHAPEQERLSPWERFIAACAALADADSEDDLAYERACSNARTAGRAWSSHLQAVAAAKARWAGATAAQRAQQGRAMALGRWGRTKAARARDKMLTSKHEQGDTHGRQQEKARTEHSGRRQRHARPLLAGHDAADRQAVPEGLEPEPGRTADDGQGDPRDGAESLAQDARATGSAGGLRGRDGSLSGVRGGVGQGGYQADRSRGRKDRVDR